MLHRMRKLPSPALVIAFIALVAAIGTGSAWALSGSNSVFADDIRANAVGASEIKANAVGGSEIRANAVRGSELANNTVTSGKVRDNSLTGADIDESTLNLPNTGGGGGGGGGNTGPNLISFTKRLAANETQTQTVGNFTVSSATNGAGTCGAIQLQSGNLDSQRSIGLAAAFANLAANATATITAANTSQAFTGVSDDGTSAVSGVVGRAQQGNTCLLTGYLTGN
jgi:hypothetical protein